MTAIEAFCSKNELPWSDLIEDRLERYVGLLEKFNETMNLIGPMGPSEIIDTLIIDSLAAAAVCEPAGPVLDVGTGAGVPGVPLSILYPDLPFTLVEPRKKRSTFLKIVRTRLDLDELDLRRCRIEEFAEKTDATFDYVISKAFRPPLEWLETAESWLSENGIAVCMTRPAEREGLVEKAGELGLQMTERVDDTREIGAPVSGETRAIYAFGRA